jgi:hypothetical protein
VLVAGNRSARACAVLGDLIDQRAKHRQPGDAVRQHVVHDDEQPGAAAGQPG